MPEVLIFNEKLADNFFISKKKCLRKKSIAGHYFFREIKKAPLKGAFY